MKHKILSVFKWITIVFFVIILMFFVIRGIGRWANNETPEGGINKSMYIKVNGSRQWINIYGKDRNNPVLLYLHGGPGSSTSEIDYVFTRKWADVYTVVTWDQRNSGKSYSADQNDTVLTKDLFIEDGKQVTEFILNYLSKDRITLLGHSWGSLYGANLSQKFPQYYDCFIGTGQMVDQLANEYAFKEEAKKWAGTDKESLKLVNRLTPDEFSMDYIMTKNELMRKYGYDMMANGADYNLISTIIFNPNYSILDWINLFKRDFSVYLDFLKSKEFLSFSLHGKYNYMIPYYNINGDKDYQTNFKLAQDYFNKVKAPHKELFIMENMTHGLLESDSEGFSKIIHKIAESEKETFR